MITVTTIFAIASIASAQITTPIRHTIYTGQNYTLWVPKNYSNVLWIYYTGSWQTSQMLCEGSKVSYPELKHNCTDTNLTLINVNASYTADYYAYNKSYSNTIIYKIKVQNLTTPQPPKPTTTIVITTTKSKKPAKTSYKPGIFETLFLSRQISDHFENSTLADETQIPVSMIGIITAVVVGLVIIIICMITYACCYRKFHHEKVDPLLNFDF
ncbi:E3 CR1-beta [Human mastadenovirus B]|nr:E3 CR1-beta [Human mastadenovirus B]